MQLLSRRIEWHLQRSHRQDVFTEELVVKINRLRECFAGGTLPLPTDKVIAAWNDLPNKTRDISPMSMKTKFISPRAPPPTPMGLDLDMDDATSSESSFNDSHGDGWVYVHDTDPIPIAVASRGYESSIASDDFMPRYLDRCLGKQDVEEDSLQSSDTSSPSSSDQGSPSCGSRTSSTPVGFHHTVDQWFLDYRARGTELFIESLIAFGVVSPGTAPLASRIARAIIKRVTKVSHTEGRRLEDAIRFSALASFKKCWESDDTWMEESSLQYGTNISSFIGSLFDAKISSERDVHLCLSFLSEGKKRFDRLCAMHALLVQANDKLCKNRNLPVLMRFRDGITSKDKESGGYVWATTPHSQMVLTDILTTIERWMALQALKRDQSQMSSGNRTIRNKAVGPRLRNSAVEPLAR